MLKYIICFMIIGFCCCNEIPANSQASDQTVESNPLQILNLTVLATTEKTLTPCICGVYLSGQFTRGKTPSENPVFMSEQDDHYGCNSFGSKQCQNKCLEVMVKYLSQSPALICAGLDRDCDKERAYLFIKNCNDVWKNTNLSTGRGYCCKNNAPCQKSSS